jgi:hypothetical protein
LEKSESAEILRASKALRMTRVGRRDDEEETMSEGINPEAGQPSTVQSFVMSDRNPVVTNWGGTDAGGGQIVSPGASEERVTPVEAPLPADAGVEE